MTQRLRVRDKQTPEAAREVFDGRFGVSGWALPGTAFTAASDGLDGTPWWWRGEEEAADSFLKAMGVQLG